MKKLIIVLLISTAGCMKAEKISMDGSSPTGAFFAAAANAISSPANPVTANPVVADPQLKFQYSALGTATLNLELNGSEIITVSATSPTTFSTILTTGNSFEIKILNRPNGSSCLFSNHTRKFNDVFNGISLDIPVSCINT
jgi:hypothetical protein